MAYDIFLRLDTIPGESMDTTFRGQIELSSLTSGLHHPAMVGSSPSDAKPSADQFVVTKLVDSASVPLAKAVLTGARLANGRISFRRAGETRLAFLTMDVKYVVINDIQWVSSIGDELPGEQVTLAFGEIMWTYTRQNQDGTTSQTRYGWSFITNSPV